MSLAETSTGYSSWFNIPKRPNLSLEESETLGQYHIQSYGGPATGSSVTLSEWVPIGIPDHLVDSTEPPSPDSENSSLDDQKQLFRKTANRFSAWVKRSGKRLVIRFQSRSRSKTPEFTEIQLAGYEKAELPGTPFSQLYQDAWSHSYSTKEVFTPFGHFEDFGGDTEKRLSSIEELPDSSKSELPSSTTATELPTLQDLAPLVPRIDVTTTEVAQAPSRLLIPGPRPRSRSNSAVSPAGTVTSSISTAETAVSALDTSGVSPRMDHWSTVARGLSIVGSQRYRCSPDQIRSTPSRTERVEVTSIDDVTSNPSHKNDRKSPSMLHGRFNKTVDSEHVKELRPPETRHESESGIQVLLTQDGAEQTLQRGLRPRTVKKSVSNKLVYKQDLHITAAVTHSTMFAGEMSLAEDSVLRQIKALLDKQLVPSATKVETHAPKDGTVKPSSLQTSASKYVLTTEEPSKQLLDSQPLRPDPAQDSVNCRNETHREEPDRLSAHPPNNNVLADRDVAPEVPTESSCAGGLEAVDVEKAFSPISPLTDEEGAKHPTATLSPLDPMTPMTLGESQGERPSFHGVEGGELPDSQVQTLVSDSSPVILAHPKEPLNTSKPDCETITPNANNESAIAQTCPGRSSVIYNPQPNHSRTPNAGFLADYSDYQSPNTQLEETPVPLIGLLTDDKIPAKYKNTRIRTPVPQIDTTVADRSPPTAITPKTEDEDSEERDFLLRTGRAEPQYAGFIADSCKLIVSSLTRVVIRSSLWVQRHCGEEPAVPDGHVRVRWKCTCGDHLYDDFLELRPGAASLLEARLNRHAIQPYSMPRSNSRSSSASFRYTPNSASQPTSSATSLSSSSTFGTPSRHSFKRSRVDSSDGTSRDLEIFPYQGSRFLLTCVNEAKNTPKLIQLRLHKANILSDKDLAVALRDHYTSVNRSWYRRLRLRGLTSIEFVQFYKHRNHFADIRKRPDVPPNGISHDYEFDPSDLLPPVGPHYLVHLFKHPHEYDEEVIAYQSIPKKARRLDGGIGWGIQLIEGFLPERIWIWIIASMILFGCAFALIWSITKHDLQGAFGVAGFVTTLTGVVFGLAQAHLG